MASSVSAKLLNVKLTSGGSGGTAGGGGSGGGSGSGTGGGGSGDLGELQSAYDIMVSMLKEWGLEALAPIVRGMLVDGRTPDQISVLLQDTEEYKKRFAGNELRRQKGLAVLSPRDYLATEMAYRQIMESAGLPPGFYDSPEDFVQWIADDVSPLEIKNRVDSALEVAFRLDEDTARAFQEFYGISQSNLAAYFLDRERGLMELEKISRAGLLGGAATAQDVQLGRERAEQLAISDLVSPEDYRLAMARVAGLSRDVGRLAGIHGGTYGQTSAEQEVFFADERAQQQRRRLRGAEQAEFAQGTGVTSGSLAQAVGQI